MSLWGCDKGAVKSSSSCSTICIRGEKRVCRNFMHMCKWGCHKLASHMKRGCCPKKLHPLWSHAAGYLITHYRLGFDLHPALWRPLSSYISYGRIYFLFLLYNCALCNIACMNCLACSKIFLHEQKETKNSPITSVKYYVEIRLKNHKHTW